MIALGMIARKVAIYIIAEFRQITRKEAAELYDEIELQGKDEEMIRYDALVKICKYQVWFPDPDTLSGCLIDSLILHIQ